MHLYFPEEDVVVVWEMDRGAWDWVAFVLGELLGSWSVEIESERETVHGYEHA